MKTFKGTKGEWFLSGNNKFILSDFPTQICELDQKNPQKLENAKLIAAAPDLLEALQNIVNSFNKKNFFKLIESGEGLTEGRILINKAEKAISKALD